MHSHRLPLREHALLGTWKYMYHHCSILQVGVDGVCTPSSSNLSSMTLLAHTHLCAGDCIVSQPGKHANSTYMLTHALRHFPLVKSWVYYGFVLKPLRNVGQLCSWQLHSLSSSTHVLLLAQSAVHHTVCIRVCRLQSGDHANLSQLCGHEVN